MKTYHIPVLFSQRMQKSRMDNQFPKFLNIFKKIKINIPFAEVLTQMPHYAKFMKEILSKKGNFDEEGVVILSATCSVVIHKNLPLKMQDLGSFTIPCTIGNYEFVRALCDSGESINQMPLSVVKRLSLGELIPTVMTLQMVDKTMAQPRGI